MHRVLVVDDEPMLRILTARALRDCGYEVVEAPDGMAAYELAQAQPFDLVVTDSRMPNMTGMELVTRLRSIHPDLPILHISGSLGESSEPKNIPADIPTLYKPFDICDLVKETERLLASGARDGVTE
jgi:CheY-like chemotaxis protein